MRSLRGVRIRYFALALSLIVLGIGVWQTFFVGRGFIKTEATIVSIEESETSTDDETSYDVTVRYTVDGQEYTGLLNSYSPTYKVGKTVAVRYNPADPTEFQDASGIMQILMGVALVVLVLTLLSWVREKRSQKDLEERRVMTGEVTYPVSAPGPERKLYFITDLGTPKFGHRIEDSSRRVLYEAKMTKFTLTTPFGFDFIDHEHGRTTPHLIGHQESTEWNTFLIDDHSTFTFDGEYIWQHLKRNGITVDSSLSRANLLKTAFVIYRNGVKIATVQASSQYVHEEDAAAHGRVANALPAFGHYRIRTTETDLALLFLTVVAFARTDATTGEGGNRKTIWNTLTQGGDDSWSDEE